MKKISVLLAALALAGCAGTNFDWSRAKQVQVGTTEAELLAIMGSPPSIVKAQGDKQVFGWSNSGLASYNVVWFPMLNGVVTSVPFIP